LSYGSKKFEGGLQKAEVELSDDAQQGPLHYFSICRSSL